MNAPSDESQNKKTFSPLEETLELPVPSPAGADAAADATLEFSPAVDRKSSPQPTTHKPAKSAQPAIQAHIGDVGDYELLEEIGRGGMGVVFRARQRSLNRMVAVKMVLAGGLASDDDVQRFHIEAEAAANLRHPGIVAVYEVGKAEERHFFSMEYVEGVSLNEMVLQEPLSAEAAARIVQSVSHAIHFAHENGVLHRDLKPSNILVDSSGQPKVADFGLAKRVANDSNLTASGRAVGTPSYMPPEQAAGDHGVVGPTSDVYSLGAVLYELVTGRPPFRAASAVDTLMQVVHNEPASPRVLNPKVPLDLETICLKCLQKSQNKRYGSAAELAEDLGRFLRGEPIQARRIGPIQRGWRWCRRNPALAGLTAALAAALLIGLAGVTWQWQRVERQRQTAQQNFDQLTKATDLALEVIEQWLERIPQEERTDQRVLEQTLKTYEKLLQQQPTNAEAREQLGRAHFRVAEIRRQLGQYDLAVSHYQLASRAQQQLAIEFPKRSKYRRQWSQTANWLGEALRKAGRFDDAEKAYRQASQLQQDLIGEHPSDPSYQGDLARSYYNLGLVCSAARRTPEAEEWYRRSIKLLQQTSVNAIDSPHLRQDLARCHLNLGILWAHNRPKAAQSENEKSIQLLGQLARDWPDEPEYRLELATVHANQGSLLLSHRRHLLPERKKDAGGEQAEKEILQSAQSAFDKAISLLTDLADEYVGVPIYRQQLANCFNGLGGVYLVSKNLPQAEAAFVEARRRWNSLVKQKPKQPDYHSQLAVTMANLASLRKRREGPSAGDQPRALLEQAVSHQAKALNLNPQNAGYRSLLHRHRYSLARLLVSLGDHSAVIKQLKELASDPNTDEAILRRAADLVDYARQKTPMSTFVGYLQLAQDLAARIRSKS